MAVYGAPGIIPARAGFTERLPITLVAEWDHPRSRGVYSCGPEHMYILPGSSPLARGLRYVGLGMGVRAGIIPARAGFTPRGVRG